MCGRYLYNIDIDDIISSYNSVILEGDSPDSFPKGEIFPGIMIPVILAGSIKTLKLCKWGFLLKSIKKELINIRLETALEKPVFKNPLLTKRCVIPATAFFEWEKKGSSNIKHCISVKDKKLFSMAGIYEQFRDINGDIYFGVAILTMPADNMLIKIHDRMPVILNDTETEKWLSNLDETEFVKLQKQVLWHNNTAFSTNIADGEIQLSLDI
jgi:Uncharacterized conserved protein